MTCKNLIRDFIKEYLYGEIENLKSFDFNKLKNDDKFSKTTSNGFDADDTELARAIYFIVWEGVLPELNEISDIGTGKKYRGDTLNTFNTLFGSKSNENPCFRLKKYSNDDSLIESVNKFHETYLTIGNFMLMPNHPFGKNTINTYRGSYLGYRDYFDRFLFELNKCLINDDKKDKNLDKLIELNKFYFNGNDIHKITEANFLEIYFESKEVKELFFRKEHSSWKFGRTPSEEDKQEYVKFANNYVSKATEIINYRADKIIGKLKSRL